MNSLNLEKKDNKKKEAKNEFEQALEKSKKEKGDEFDKINVQNYDVHSNIFRSNIPVPNLGDGVNTYSGSRSFNDLPKEDKKEPTLKEENAQTKIKNIDFYTLTEKELNHINNYLNLKIVYSNEDNGYYVSPCSFKHESGNIRSLTIKLFKNGIISLSCFAKNCKYNNKNSQEYKTIYTLMRSISNSKSFSKPYCKVKQNGEVEINVDEFVNYMSDQYSPSLNYFNGSLYYYSNGYYRNVQDDLYTMIWNELPTSTRNNRRVSDLEISIRKQMSMKMPKLNFISNKIKFYINFKNGIYDLINKKMIPHTKELVFLNQIPFNYNPEAPVNNILDNMLTNYSNGDYKQREQLLILVVLVMSNYRNLKNWFFLYGETNTGKSTFCHLLKKLLTGDDKVEHYSSIPLYWLDESDFYLSSIIGKQANILTESADNPIKSVETLRKLTGGQEEEIQAKVKYAVKPVKFLNTALLINAGNALPRLWNKGDKTAFIKRAVIFEFKHVNDANGVENIQDQVDIEYLIRLAIPYFEKFQENKCKFPISINNENFQGDLRSLSDPVTEYLANMYAFSVDDDKNFITQKQVYDDLVSEFDNLEITKHMVAEKLKKIFPYLGIKNKRMNGNIIAKCYVGLTIKGFHEK